MIYAITDGKRIKIGFTDQTMKARLREMQTGNAETLTPIRTYLPGTMITEKHGHKTFGHCQIYRDNGRKSEWFVLTEDIVHEYFDLIGSFIPLDQHALDLISEHFKPDITEKSVLEAEKSPQKCMHCQKNLRMKCGYKRITVQGWPDKSPCCSRKIKIRPHGRYCSKCRKPMFETTVRKTVRFLLDELPGIEGLFCSMSCAAQYGIEKAKCETKLTDCSESLIAKAS